ncbi:MAG: RloB domain-containing protein, partial [Saprospiraceae bacterium]
YFKMLKQHEKDKLPKLDVKPELPKKKNLKDQYETVVKNLKMGYDKVIWLLDFDTFIKEDKQKKKGEPSAIDKLKKYKRDLKKEYKDRVHIFMNTPCLEFWILLHYRETGKFYAKCDNAQKDLKKNFLNDYEKTEKYYKKPNNDIYKRLKPYQEKAFENARKLGTFDFDDCEKAKAEIYKILCILGIQSCECNGN